MTLDKNKNLLRGMLPRLTVFLCLSQPILDLISYWQIQWGLPNLYTMFFRLFLLLGGLIVGFLVTDRRKCYFWFAAVIGLYLAGHILACSLNEGGYQNPDEDLTDQLRTLVMPLTALTLISFERQNPKVFPALVRGIVLNMTVILCVELVSVITGTDPHTYSAKGIGTRGWFVWTSPQSAILSIGAPITIAWAAERYPKRILPAAAASLCCFGMLYCFGTRLTFVSMVAVGLGLSVCLLCRGRERIGQALAVLVCVILFTALYPVSPMARNRAAVLENARIKQERVSDAAAAEGAAPGARQTEDPAALRAAYRYNLQGMIDRFGLERVAEKYQHTLDADRICDDRVMKNTFCSLLMEDAVENTVLARWFGIELGRTRQYETEVYEFETDSWVIAEETYDPENDFSGVYYLCGLAGLLLTAGFLLCFAVRTGFAFLHKKNPLSDLMLDAFSGALVIAVVYAIDTASVLRRNNASIYLAFLLAGLWELTKDTWEKRRSA